MKICFFDIDGTLWDERFQIPESTREAVRRVRAAENLVFINSGRTRAFIHADTLFSLKLDGLVSGCGTMLEVAEKGAFIDPDYHRNRVIASTEPALEEKKQTIAILERYHIMSILEGIDDLFADMKAFGHDPFFQIVAEDMGEHLLPFEEAKKSLAFSKLSCDLQGLEHREQAVAELKEMYTYIPHYGDTVCELVPKGCSKGTGILKICETLGVPVADTYAFGDSYNDLEMMKTAGTSIAMGNAEDAVKQAAGLVTKPLKEDGIYYACEKLGLF